MFINGMPVLVNPLASTIKHIVQRHPIRKRRGNWDVVLKSQPCCYIIADQYIVMHPDLYFKLKEIT